MCRCNMLVYNYMFRLCTAASLGRHRFTKRLKRAEGSPNKQRRKFVITVNSDNCYSEKGIIALKILLETYWV
jgi:hypothetical protein